MPINKEIKPNQGVIDKGLEKWQGWNKAELFIEGTAISIGYVFGIPGLIALGAAGAGINALQMLGINMVQKWRERSGSKRTGMEKTSYSPNLQKQVFPNTA